MVSAKDYKCYMARPYADPIFWFIFVWLMKGLFRVVDIPLKLFFSYSLLHGKTPDRMLADNYENSAHVVNVVTRAACSLAHHKNERNFLFYHDSYVHPKYILNNDNVNLYEVFEDRVIFTVSDKDVAVSDSKNGPFYWGNCFIAAEKLIILPMKHFHRLAEESGDPTLDNHLNIIMIDFTLRSGSTLLGRTTANLVFYIIYKMNKR